MSFYDFVSPGSEAHDSIVAGLLQREQLKRQAMLDELNRRNIESEMADREQNRRIQEQNATSQEAERQAHAAERQAVADKAINANRQPGSDITGNDAAISAAKRQGIGVLEQGGETLPSKQTIGVLGPGAGTSSPVDLSPVASETKESPSQKDSSVPKHQIYVGSAIQLGMQKLGKDIEQSQAAGKPMDEGKVTQQLMELGVPGADVKNYVEEMFKRGTQHKAHILDASGKIVNEFDIDSANDVVHGLPKPEDTSGGSVGLTPAAVDMAAAQIARTGSWQALRSLGISKMTKTEKEAIMNRAAQYNVQTGAFNEPGQGGAPNLARNAAETGAAGSALKQLTENAAAVESFSNTAKLNTQLFNRIKGEVPDWGSKALNYPVRKIADLFGSEAMSDFQVIRQSLQNEYARLISQPSLKGVLSDSARHEIEVGMSDNATIGQLEHALSTFAKETENRRKGFATEIEKTKGSLGPSTIGGVKPEVKPEAKKSKFKVTIE